MIERISPNRNSPRNHKIDRLTIHCFVGQVTAEEGLAVFAKKSKKASCNYVVGRDGSVGLCVPEGDRSWCSSSPSNDHRAITIEVASNTTHPYSVANKAMDALLDLIEDICRRNGKRRLVWLGDKKRTLKYEPADDELVMTVHRWFANKACPGQYLLDRHPEIVAEINARLSGGAYESKPSGQYTVRKGDTLYSLAKKWCVRIEDIIKYNKKRYPNIWDMLGAGWKLDIPGRTYTVQKGDTLWRLSRRWGCSVDGIVEANKDRYPNIRDMLYAGWVITIPKN